MTENRSRVGLYSILSLVFVIFFIIILSFFTPRHQEPVFRPLPNSPLKVESGQWVTIKEEYPGQDLLLLFYIDTSQTSINQLIELTKVAAQIPQSTTAIVIHIGRTSKQLPVIKPDNIHYYLDPEAEFTRNTGIDIVPTLLYVSKNSQEMLFAEGLVSAEEILNHLQVESGSTSSHPTLNIDQNQ